jgi:hypothetical protein
MAAIDFPASPTNGQVFAAPNGVTYIYSSAYTAWQAQPMSAGFVGDFCAVSTADISLTGAGLVLICPTVLAGNAGSWYNPANGRYTPPKGRYFVSGSMSAFNGGGTGGSSIIYLRKNGVQIANGYGTTTPASNQGMAVVQYVVDANGTDYFELFGLTGASQGLCRPTFQAFPISPNANMVQGTGDFHTAFAVTGFTSTLATLFFPAAMTGNAGGWYNPSNGRYTPPAGRYFIYSTIGAGHNASATMITVTLRKNGVPLEYAVQVPGTANWVGDPSVQGVFDANGTDWFDVQASCNNGSNINSWCWFGAFPISGIKGPQGDPGAVGQAGANAFNIRATASDTINGPNYVSLFRTASAPVIDYDPTGVLSVLASNTFFTAPNAGRYHFEAYSYTVSNPAGQAMLAIQHQTSAGAVIRTYAAGENNDPNVYGATRHISLDLQMAAGERIYFLLAAQSGACNTAVSGTIGGLTAQALTYAFGHRIN